MTDKVSYREASLLKTLDLDPLRGPRRRGGSSVYNEAELPSFYDILLQEQSLSKN